MSELFSKRRHQALSIAVAIVVGLLVYRLIDIQIAKHEHYLTMGKKQWVRKTALPARRGNIFDRNGVPLAVTRWTYTVGVTPANFPIKQRKAVEYLADACGLSQKELRRRLDRDNSYVLLGKDLHLTEDQVSTLSSYPSIRLDPSHDRLYPFESMPAQLVGAVSPDGRGIAGVELAYNDLLAGEDGWVLMNKLPSKDRVEIFQPINAPGKDPRNGDDLYLTIDTRIQSIVDFELEQAVERYKAVGGMAIVVDPAAGGILALSERPVRALSRSDADAFSLRSVSGMYEPGSTFKLITDSFLLENGRVDPYDTFFGENGEATFPWGKIHDDKPHGWLTFRESFVHSSNICTIKAADGTSPTEFYRYILHFGFAGRTGLDLPAESRGRLEEPDVWRARSLPSIAIGHEIGVTAIQMAMAYAALADDGELMVPRIALEVRDAKGQPVERFKPVPVRRVFSHGTAVMMQDFCRGVVLEGTGVKAATEGISVAGKTGTSQKAIGGHYVGGKYVVSFVGFAPAVDPRLVCLVVLDEPCYPYWWGGESAAVVFSEIVEGIHISTDLFYGAAAGRLAGARAPRERAPAPSFLRLTTDQAIDLAAERALHVQCPQGNGIVYSQIPDPGTLIDRRDDIVLVVRPEGAAPDSALAVPELRGLSIREARLLLLADGFGSVVRGFGVVERQEPPAGRTAPRGASVTLFCGPRTSAAAADLANNGNGATP
jgi:stage V sporulation protein D (sporulation-specific penicillin-binding protein)